MELPCKVPGIGQFLEKFQMVGSSVGLHESFVEILSDGTVAFKSCPTMIVASSFGSVFISLSVRVSTFTSNGSGSGMFALGMILTGTAAFKSYWDVFCGRVFASHLVLGLFRSRAK